MRLLLVSAETAPFRGGVAEVVDGLARALHAPPGAECTVVGPRRGAGVRASLGYPYRGYLGGGGPGSRLELLGLLGRLVLCARRSDVVVAADVVAQRALSLVPRSWRRRRRVWLVAAARRNGVRLGAVLVGEGPDRPRLEALAWECGVTAEVCFAGGVSDAEKIAWLDAADLVVQPSRQEGFVIAGLGLAMAEAGARGKAVVSSRHGGIPEAVTDGITGLLARPGDAEDTAAKIVRLLDDPGLARRMGEEAACEVARRFSLDRHCDEVEAVYDSLLAAGTARASGRRGR